MKHNILSISAKRCLTVVAWALMVQIGGISAWAETEMQQVQYVCLMDPDVKSDSPGKCPKCGMELRASAPDSKPAGLPGSAGNAAPATGGSALKMKIPDTIVYDQDGRKLHFYTDLVKGKTVAINFIFTTCTTICPPLAATFSRIQRILGPRIGRDITLISVSVDPTVDVPQRMKTFLDKFQARPGWTFVSGSKQEIDTLLDALGSAVPDKTDHTAMVLVGNDQAGYWTRAYGLAAAATLAEVIRKTADGEVADIAGK